MPMSGSILQLASRQVDLSGGIITNIIPSTSDSYDIGSSDKLFRAAYLSELHSLLFVENTIVLLGSKFVVGKGQGSLPYFVSASSTQIDFGIPMTQNDFVLFRMPLQVEAMQIGTLASGSTVYNATRNVDGTIANDWVAGSVFLILGNTGDGRIELDAQTSPRMNIVSQGNTWNGGSELVRIGDLDGNWGYSGSTFGAAFGEYTTNKGNITIDSTNGLRLRTYNTTVIQFDNSGSAMITGRLTMPGVNSAIAIGETPPSGSANGTGLFINREGLFGLESNVPQAYINSNGKLLAGGGDVVIDSDGLSILSSSGSKGTTTVKFLKGSSLVGGLSSYDIGAYHYFDINNYSISGSNSYINIQSQSPIGMMSRILLSVGLGGMLVEITKDDAISGSTAMLIKGGGLYVGDTGDDFPSISSGDLKVKNDIYTIPLTDYSATSTVVGWSSFSLKTIYYKKIGKTVFVYFDLLGTSNSGSTTFTLPYNNSGAIVARFVYRAQDNGGALVVAPGQMAGGSGSAILYSDMAGGLWTSSGQKSAFGQFFYETS